MLNIVLRLTAILPLCAATLMTSPAYAWSDAGHMIVAQIAYDKIAAEDPRAKIEIERLLAMQVAPVLSTAASNDSVNEFISASHWADDIKHIPGYTDTADEHYIDYPFSTDGTQLPINLPKAVNIVTALTKYVRILQSPLASDSNKAVALRFVIHLVGDIHQPLHCVTRVSSKYPRGDLGGNKMMLSQNPSLTVNQTATTITLHSFWDGGLGSLPHKAPHSGTHFAPPQFQISQAAADISASYRADPQWKNNSPFDYTGWSHESQHIATSFVYQGLVDAQEPDENYVSKGTQIARSQLFKAGYRLAALLEAIWPKSSQR